MTRLTVKEARLRRGLTQEQLETLSGVTQSVISRIETGDVTDPNVSTALKLARGLRIDPRALKFAHETEAVSA